MEHKKILCILTWAFTLAAIFFAIHTAATGTGGIAAVMLMTFAIAAQSFYGKELRKK